MFSIWPVIQITMKKSNKSNFLTVALILALSSSCNSSVSDMGTYKFDKEFLEFHKIKTVELTGNNGNAKVLIVPEFQGRVMTSSSSGDSGNSYGWINYKYIEEGIVQDFFNPYGGEERFWIGPEGGPNSFYFAPGKEQVYENWKVPAAIDTESYEIAGQDESSIEFSKESCLMNASGNEFKISIHRKISILDYADISDVIGCKIPEGMKVLAYVTENTIKNVGNESWNREYGMPSVWLLGTFNPTPTTTVFIPYNQDTAGKIVNDEYFGKVPEDRLIVENGMIFFKIDGKFRSKIGLPKGSARDICGSYDTEKHVLNILKYSVPQAVCDYVNGQWGPQEDPFCGDVINSYNDGPTETGYVQGPFYEIETSSPGAALEPGRSLTHTQYTIHLEGSEEELSKIAQAIFGVNLAEVSEKFRD